MDQCDLQTSIALAIVYADVLLYIKKQPLVSLYLLYSLWNRKFDGMALLLFLPKAIVNDMNFQ